MTLQQTRVYLYCGSHTLLSPYLLKDLLIRSSLELSLSKAWTVLYPDFSN
jgi:hypothetical protein